MCCGREEGETAAAAAPAAAAKSHPCLAAFPNKRLSMGARGETAAGDFPQGRRVGTAAGPRKRARRLRHEGRSGNLKKNPAGRTAPAALAASYDTQVATFRASSKPAQL